MMRKRWILLVALLTILFLPSLATAQGISIVGSVDINYGATTSIYVANGGNDYSYFYDGLQNIFSIDVTNPTLPTQVDSITLPGVNFGIERRIARNGDYLYVPRSGGGNPDMDIVIISNPANLTYSNSISLGTVRFLAIENNKLYSTGDGPIAFMIYRHPLTQH